MELTNYRVATPWLLNIHTFLYMSKKRHFNLLIFHNMAVKEREKVIICTLCTYGGWWWNWESWKKISSMAFEAKSTAYNPMRTFSDKIFYDQQFFLVKREEIFNFLLLALQTLNFSSRFTKCWWNLNVFHKFISLHTSMPCFIPKLINFHYNFWTDFSIFSLVSRQLLCSSRQVFLIEWWKFSFMPSSCTFPIFMHAVMRRLKSPKSSLPNSLNDNLHFRSLRKCWWW